jgi:hypothetical protein
MSNHDDAAFNIGIERPRKTRKSRTTSSPVAASENFVPGSSTEQDSSSTRARRKKRDLFNNVDQDAAPESTEVVNEDDLCPICQLLLCNP